MTDKLRKIDSELRTLKQDYVVNQKDFTHTIDTVGCYYKVGKFKVDITITDSGKTTLTRPEKFVTCTMGDQIFVSRCDHHSKKWTTKTLHGVLYDHYFPKDITVQLYDEKHLTKNNAISTGYKAHSALAKGFRQKNINDSIELTQEVELRNIESPHDKLYCKVTIKFKVTNEPIAKDRDVTHVFQDSMQLSTTLFTKSRHPKDEFQQRHKGLKGLHVILVPGLFTGAYPGYFDENKKAMHKMGISHSVAPIKSEDPVIKNAEVIRKYVTKIYKKNPDIKIILMTHSKGGCDALDAVLYDPHHELQHIIFGIINMQSPIGGSPVIDWLDSGHNATSVLAKGTGLLVDKVFNMNATGAVTDLTVEHRMKYMDKVYKKGGAKEFNLPKQLGIHFLSFCSFADYGESSNLFEACGKVSMGVTNKKIEEFGHRSDGMVCMQSGRIPGGDTIFVDNAYHTTPALHMKGNAYHSGQLTIALLDVMLLHHGLKYSSSVNVNSLHEMMAANAGHFNQEVPGYLPKEADHTPSGTQRKIVDMTSPTVSKLAGRVGKLF